MQRTAALLSLALIVTLGASAWGQPPAATQQLLLGVQRICPVSGQPLGEHGQPVRARIGEQVVYLCCDGCLRSRVDSGHWAAVQANLAKAQRSCPVMGKALPKDAASTVVQGRRVYLCCPPCGDKIEAEPEKYLRVVDDLYAASLKADRGQQAAPPTHQHHH